MEICPAVRVRGQITGGICAADQLRQTGFERCNKAHNYQEETSGEVRQTGEFDNQPKTHQGKLAEDNRDNLQKFSDSCNEIARYMRKMTDAIRMFNKHDQIETGMMDHHAENVGQTTGDACECDRKRNIALMTMETHFGDRDDSEIVEADVFNKQDEIEHRMMGQHEDANWGGVTVQTDDPKQEHKVE
jgi:hypothetical protein